MVPGLDDYTNIGVDVHKSGEFRASGYVGIQHCLCNCAGCCSAPTCSHWNRFEYHLWNYNMAFNNHTKALEFWPTSPWIAEQEVLAFSLTYFFVAITSWIWTAESPYLKPDDIDPNLGIIRVDALDGTPLATGLVLCFEWSFWRVDVLISSLELCHSRNLQRTFSDGFFWKEVFLRPIENDFEWTNRPLLVTSWEDLARRLRNSLAELRSSSTQMLETFERH